MVERWLANIDGQKLFRHIDLNQIQLQHEDDLTIANKNAFRHIVELIFNHLGPNDMAKCRLVCHSWRASINNLKKWHILQLKKACSKTRRIKYKRRVKTGTTKDEVHFEDSRFLKIFPYWKETFDFFEKEATLLNLKKFTSIMLTYFKSEEATRNCPVFCAILPDINYDILHFFRDETLLDFNKVHLQPLRGIRLPFLIFALTFEWGFKVVQFLFEGESRKALDPEFTYSPPKILTFPEGFQDAKPLQWIMLQPMETTSKFVPLFLDHSAKFEMNLNMRSKHHDQTLIIMLMQPNEIRRNENKVYITNTLEVLFKHPASRKNMDFNAKDTFGMTAFHYACAHGLIQEIKLFLVYAKELGINLFATNKNGETPLDLAKKNNHHVENMETDILPLLEHELSKKKTDTA